MGQPFWKNQLTQKHKFKREFIDKYGLYLLITQIELKRYKFHL